MEQFLRRLLIGIALLSAIIWSGIVIFGEEPAAKSPEEIRKERYKRCQWILQELYPSELRTDVNLLAVLADKGIFDELKLQCVDGIGRDFQRATEMYLEGHKLNEDLFGENPDPDVDEKRFEECLKALNELGNKIRNDIRDFKTILPLAGSWEKIRNAPPVAPPKTLKEKVMLEETVAQSLANQLALLAEAGLLAAAEMKDAEALALKFLHAAYLRFKTNHEIKAGNQEQLEKDLTALHALLDSIEEDERRLWRVIFNLPNSKRFQK